jgi:hypothetical protein
MAYRWTHDTTVTVIVGPEGGEDSIDYDVRLYVSGSPGTPDHFDKGHGNWLPGDPPEVELERFEICEHAKCPRCKGSCWEILPAGVRCAACRGLGRLTTYRKPLPACYPDSNDQGVIDAVEAWFADNAETCWESLELEACE